MSFTTRGNAALLLTSLCIALPAAAQTAPSRPAPLVVPARELPAPTTVSPELQRILAAAAHTPLNVPADAVSLRAAQARSDDAAARTADIVWHDTRVTVTTTALDGVRAYVITPAIVDRPDRRLIVLHGGAFLYNAGKGSTVDAAVIADATRTIVIALDYRLPPDHPYPAAVDDVVAAWRALIATHRPASLALAGLSSGGAIAMSAVQRLAQLGVPLPAALVLGSPWADLSPAGDTYATSAGVDHVLGSYDVLAGAARWYAGTRALTDPGVSPLYGDMHAFPPTLLVAGTRDLFLSHTVRTHRSLRRAGVRADLHVFEGQPHGAYMLSIPERDEAMREIVSFLDVHLSR